MSFRDILGHERQVAALSRGVAKDKVHHAYLFVGPKGIGRRTIAMSFAMALNCARRDGEACHECPSCRKMTAGTHPDLLVVGEDRTKLQILINEIREKVLRFVSFKVYDGPYRVILIIDCERMNTSAANALLKTLEEPPPQTVFVLTATNLSSLLPTVRSRCQKQRFSPLDDGLIAQYLVEQQSIPQEEAEGLARLSGGSLGKALGLTADHLIARGTFYNALTQVGSGPEYDPLKLAEELVGDKTLLLSQLELAESLVRDAIMLQQAPSRPLRNPDHGAVLEALSERTSFPSLDGLLRLIWELRRATRLNVNPLVALERLFLEFAELRKVDYGKA